MRYVSSVVLRLISLVFVSILVQTGVSAQSCIAPQNFEATDYNITYAKYSWNFSDDADYYVMRIDINGQNYFNGELSGQSNSFEISFNPKLVNNDQVTATLTKVCELGSSSSATADFIIVTDAVIYLTGNPSIDGPNTVEPVFTTNYNLIPGGEVCGLCDPGYFRLASGFYAPYSIALDPAVSFTIEQVRFKKGDLCDCLSQAVADGILDPNGGPGPKYNGLPFVCKLTPYVFEKKDCALINGKPNERTAPIGAETPTLAISNPISEAVNLSFNLDDPERVAATVRNVAGVVVASTDNGIMPKGDHQITLSSDSWPTGIYFLTLQTGNHFKTVKLIKI